MSLATEFVQPVPVPARVRPRLAVVPVDGAGAQPIAGGRGHRRGTDASARSAEVHVLHPPADSGSSAWHLTRRGIVVVTIAVALLGAALVWLAARSAPAPASSGASAVRGPAVVTVRAGDTLWAIADRVAPTVDPRAEVAQLQRLNGLSGVDLVPGERLRVR